MTDDAMAPWGETLMKGSQDVLVRGITEDGYFRATLLLTGNMHAEIQRRHETSTSVTTAITRVAESALLIASALKGEQVATVQVRGDGEAGLIRATGTPGATVKAYASRPEATAEGLEAVVGKEGVFEVVKDIGLGTPYHGIVPIATGRIAEDFAYYLLASEQTRSAVGMAEVEVNGELKTGAYLLQVMPGAPEDLVSSLGQPPAMGDLIMTSDRVWDAMARLFLAPFKILQGLPAAFACGCSPERLATAITMLDRDEVEAILVEGGGELPMVCQFCNTSYTFDAETIRQIFEEARA